MHTSHATMLRVHLSVSKKKERGVTGCLVYLLCFKCGLLSSFPTKSNTSISAFRNSRKKKTFGVDASRTRHLFCLKRGLLASFSKNCNACVSALRMTYILSPFILIFLTSIPSMSDLFATALITRLT